jgi:3',5'-cyclic AMP phosphodiesterase CpdA
MCAFIVNPPIRDDADYYRHDDHVVQQVLARRGKLVVGLRRSGKTSFLYRVQRAAHAAGQTCEYFELADLGDDALAAVASVPQIVLLDEAEEWRQWDAARLERLLRAIWGSTVVLTCAPQFVLELDREPDQVVRLVDRLERHMIGPLSDPEARDLLAHVKRPPGPLAAAQVHEILGSPERLAILVQALGAQRAGTDELAASLAGFGKRVLSGLTPSAHRLLIAAAQRRPDAQAAGLAPGAESASPEEVALLVKLGALRSGAEGRLEIGSELLGELVRKASHLGRPTAPHELTAPVWLHHARILHLSDLHFGRKAIDAPDVQARRLIDALTRDQVIPDLVAVTGDLSWQGDPRELSDAERFLIELADWLGQHHGGNEAERRQRIAIVPGNHEAAWALSRGIGAGGAAPTDEEIERWARYSLGPFANFANRFYQRMVWDLDEPCVAMTFAEPSVAFLALSTAHYITELTRTAKFGRRLIDRAARLLERDDVKRARFRVGLWHHNLRPFHSEQGAIGDVDIAVRGFLKSKPALDLALHGHVHQGEVEVFRPRASDHALTYSAVGSFGVTSDHRPGDDSRGRVANELAIVELRTSGPGRQMQTVFYDLRPTPDLEWEWREASRSKPREL